MSHNDNSQHKHEIKLARIKFCGGIIVAIIAAV